MYFCKTRIRPNASLVRSAALPQAPSAAGAPPASNVFKMQKGRREYLCRAQYRRRAAPHTALLADIKKSYVDVFNPSGAATRALPPAAEVLGPAAVAHAVPSYFVPSPAAQPHQVPEPPFAPPPPPTPARKRLKPSVAVQVRVSIPCSPRASPPPSPAPSFEVRPFRHPVRSHPSPPCDAAAILRLRDRRQSV